MLSSLFLVVLGFFQIAEREAKAVSAAIAAAIAATEASVGKQVEELRRQNEEAQTLIEKTRKEAQEAAAAFEKERAEVRHTRGRCLFGVGRITL